MINDFYLNAEMEAWEKASDNDCRVTLTFHHLVDGVCGECGFYILGPDEDRTWKRFDTPWTFRRVYRVWGLMAALRFLLKGFSNDI